jgi:cyclase
VTSFRVIPCLDIRDGRVVKGTNFVNIRDAGDPIELAKHYGSQGADELVFLDITASHERRETAADLAARVAEQIFIPFTVGGGIRSIADIRAILLAGADKVSLNTAAVDAPDLINSASEQYGAQCVVVAIDARRIEGGWEVYIHGGRTPTGKDVESWAEECVRRGAGEILLTSMDADGTREGYDLEITKRVAEAVGVPVIASGGAGHAGHMIDAALIGRADAVLLAGILHEGLATIPELKHAMAAAKIPVRLTS